MVYSITMQKKLTTLENKIWKKLRTVIDPELGISIVELGLIYDVKVYKSKARILMTLTTIGCPLFSIIESQIKEAILKVADIDTVAIKLTFDPPWSMEKMSENARAELGI